MFNVEYFALWAIYGAMTMQKQTCYNLNQFWLRSIIFNYDYYYLFFVMFGFVWFVLLEREYEYGQIGDH